jgi:hypothetical protein
MGRPQGRPGRHGEEESNPESSVVQSVAGDKTYYTSMNAIANSHV